MLRTQSILALLLFAFALSSCASDPTAPADAGSTSVAPSWLIESTPVSPQDGMRANARMRYPLQLGNTWKYQAHVKIQTLPYEGDPSEREVIRKTKAEIMGPEQLFGRCYSVEELTITEDVNPDDVFTQTARYRQDSSGLYEAVVTDPGPAGAGREARSRDRTGGPRTAEWARAIGHLEDRVQILRELRHGRKGGVLDDELQRLAYPLRKGASWVVADDTFFMTATVEGREVLRLPVGRTPAWRVRLEADFYGPDDVVDLFYGRDGYLGWRVFLIGEASDEMGSPLGIVSFTEEEYLEELDIDRKGGDPCEGTVPTGKERPGLDAR
jgi:hypothetical protein